MIKTILTLTIATVLSASALAGGLEWTEDFAAAQEKAKSENKPMLLNFTGSDWCGWCFKLDEEIFAKDEFINYANENLILVKVDFPRDREISEETKEQNDKLQEKYSIQGYPTLIILNSEGEQIGQMGYMDGGPEPFIAKLKEINKAS